jgi:uncharacterized protein YutE (UPF0331/DUF86 family)
MDDFEKKKEKLLYPIFFEAGAGLYDSQDFEYSLKYLLFLISKATNTKIPVEETVKYLDDETKKTTGQLFNLLKKNMDLHPVMEELILESINARNILIHHYLTDNAERMSQIQNQKTIIQEIRELRKKIIKGNECLEPIIEGLAKIFDNYDVQKGKDQMKSNFLHQFGPD